MNLVITVHGILRLNHPEWKQRTTREPPDGRGTRAIDAMQTSR